MTQERQRSRNGRILVIGDHPCIHEDYRKAIGDRPLARTALAAAELFGDEPTIADAGYAVFEVDSAFQGEHGCKMVQIALDEGRPYAMAFVDMRMPPGWDGVDTVQRIWEIDPEILVIFCSADVDCTWEEMVAKLGRTDRFLILKKPFCNIEVQQFAMVLTERWNLARADALTGILNRRALQEQLRREWARSVRHDWPLSCVMADLDFFKEINDTEGHQVGDLVLKSAASELQSRCRASDNLFRYGGEEFCVLLPETTEAEAVAWAESAREAIAAMQIPGRDRPLHVTASFGVAERVDDTRTGDSLVNRADQMLYIAKQAGRNRVVRYAATGCERSAREAVAEKEGIFQGVLARHVMDDQVAKLKCSTTVREAVRFFLDRRIYSASVVDENEKLVGIVSEKDLLGVVLSPEAWKWPISQIMQSDAVYYDEDEPIQKVFAFLSRVSMPHVIIVRDEHPVGTINHTTLLSWFSDWTKAHTAKAPVAVNAGNDSAKQPLAEAAKSLVARAERLSEELGAANQTAPPSDAYGPLADNISAMQELLAQILAFSRSAKAVRDAAAQAAQNDPVVHWETGSFI